MKQNGFIATSLLYSFFLAFVTLFIGMITIYLQNRIYLNKLEDSSKNSIYIREMKKNSSIYVKLNGNTSETQCDYVSENKFKCDTITYNFAKCETIFHEGSIYTVEGCPS